MNYMEEKDMRFPKHLQKNGTIGFVAPSFGCATEPYYSAFMNAQKKLTELGHSMVLGPNCYLSDGIGISNTPEKCAAELMEAYESKESEVLISCGGGELMCEILEHMNWDRIKKSDSKWYMGYSDNTNFTYLLATICDTASIYGPCAQTFGMEPWHESLQDAYDLLCGKEMSMQEADMKFTVSNYPAFEVESLKDAEHPLEPYNVTVPYSQKIYVGEKPQDLMPEGEAGTSMQSINIEGRLLGGCLDCLVTISGTVFDHTVDFCEKYKEEGILWFLEACDLNVFSIRRAMWQLENNGWFKYVKGFLIGRPRVAEPMMGLDQYQAVLKVAAKYQVPVIFDLDIGHVAPMMPLIVGSYAKVNAGKNTLYIEMYEKK